MTIEKPDFIDALPFVDTAIDEDGRLREFVKKLVDEELQTSQYAQHDEIILPERPFLTDILRSEQSRRDHDQPSSESSSLRQIKVDTPPPISEILDDNSVEAWTKCLNQVKIKLEYLQRQLSNLDILKNYGCPAWGRHLARGEEMKSKMDQELERLAARIRDVNVQRKAGQEQISRHLDLLQSNWDHITTRNQMLSEEICKLRSEIAAKT
jgi:hypothetical protein